MMKNIITLKDNETPNTKYECVDEENANIVDGKISKSSRKCIDEIRSIENLIKKHEVITIPDITILDKAGYQNDKIIIEIKDDKLCTNNWVGVVNVASGDGEASLRIEITSRFDNKEKQYFLLYMLCTVYGFNIFNIDIDGNDEGNYLIILVIIYINALIEALSEGVYKEYITQKYNDYNFRGAIDINRHLKLNTPFMGKTSYSVREYTYDTEILCLIRQVIDYIKYEYSDIWEGYGRDKSILNEIVEVIENATPSFRPNNNYAEAIKCNKEITHPLYQNYENVRKLALMILNESGQNIFDNSEAKSLSLLIDIAWIWEEFVAEKLLKDFNYTHLFVSDSEGKFEWADDESWYPDFIEDNADNEKRNVFDAKYKNWKWKNNSEDIHQLLSYLFISGGTKCGVIYPYNKELEKDTEKEAEKEILAFKGFYTESKPRIYKLPFCLPSYTGSDYKKYCEDMDEAIGKWKKEFGVKIQDTSSK
jgi:hypothetical protein